MNKPLSLSLLAILCAVLLSNCASGPSYADVKASGALTPHAGNGMVLIYRTPGVAASGTKPYLQANGSELSVKLARGGFYSYEAQTGPLQLSHSGLAGESTSETKTKAAIWGGLSSGILGAALAVPMDITAHRKIGLNLQVFSGSTHYVVMNRIDRAMSEVTQKQAEEEISKCRWLNPRTK